MYETRGQRCFYPAKVVVGLIFRQVIERVAVYLPRSSASRSPIH